MHRSAGSTVLKVLLLTVFILAAAGAAYYLLTSAQDEAAGPKRGTPPVGVKVARVERRDLVEMRIFIGTLEAEKQFDAAFKVGGRVQEISVDLGDCLRKGDQIARLDSEEYKQQQAQAQAELEVARASLAEARSKLIAAERNYERALKLRESKVSSAAELEAAETEKLTQQAGVSLAQAQIQQREAALRAAAVRLSYTTLTADWQADENGTCRYVAGRYVDEGDTISANTPVVTLVDLSQLKAVINVSERDYALLRIGQPADVSVDSVTDRTFTGTVMRLAPVFNQASRQARVEVAVANPESILKSGMFARVRIELGRVAQATVVPSDAVIQRLGIYGVFAVDDGHARFVELQPGIEDGGWTQVTGLEEGQQVVTLGHHLLSDGAPVSLADGEGERPRRSGRQ